MQALTTLALLLVSQISPPPGPPPLPPRAYQPTLVDPGFDGERGSQNVDLTPDGKLMIGYRNTTVTGQRIALVAAMVRPERLDTNAHGYLTNFFQYDATTNTSWNFTFGSGYPGLIEPEQLIIHYKWEPIPGSNPPCNLVQNPDYPIDVNPHLTFALRPLATGNPYRSDENGNPVIGGSYDTYKIWLVRTHQLGFESEVVCGPGGINEPLMIPQSVLDTGNPQATFVCQDLTVVVHEPSSRVVHKSVDSLPFQFLTTTSASQIQGLEPSITSDGQLIVYHGNGNSLPFFPGHGNATYIYNPNGCQPTGWTEPRSITQLPTFTGTPAEQQQKAEDFKRRYKIFAQPIRMAPVSTGHVYSDGYAYADGTSGPSDSIRGLYIWLSKDGSHYVSSSAGATEAREVTVELKKPRTRAGNYICGDLTGGYVKHIDDVGINPTRRGGPWDWPPRVPQVQDSWRTMQISTGIRPGLWEPLVGENAPLPTQIASARIPVLPLFETSIDSYGEVRFEERDGNYLLYMACNESLALPDDIAPYEVSMGRTDAPGECDMIFDTQSTPDTSGRPTRGRCVLNAGAAFPQEVLANSGFTTPPESASAELRAQIGAELGPELEFTQPVSLHENVGFKGQAIVFNATGNVTVTKVGSNPGFFLGGLRRVSAQMFVKVVDTPSSQVTLLEYGGLQGTTPDPVFTLKLNTNGKFTAHIGTTTGGLTVTSRSNALPFGQSLYDSRSGWRHVAATFDGDMIGQSRLRIYLDGVLDATIVSLATSFVRTPAGAGYYVVGPGRGTSPDPVDDDDMLFVIDEVAFSDVARGVGEIKRDAYVPSAASGFGDFPEPEPALPMSLDITEAKWPVGLAYDADVALLGRDLFAHNILSLSQTISCSTCHKPDQHFATENQPVVPGVLNIPTILNAAFGTHKFFDGSAAALEDQVWRPITGGEMGPQTVASVLAKLNAGGSPFATRFTDAATFGAPASQDNVATAIAMYMRTLNSGGSAFDNELWAEANDGNFEPTVPVMTQDQRDGRALFFGKARCVACHRGTSFTDDAFHNVLTVKTAENNGFRGTFTGRAAELGKVKTPTLRNILNTGPYFHDGSAGSLAAVIDHYDDPPFGDTNFLGSPDVDLRPLGLTADEKHDLEEFLKALSGTLP